MLTLEQLTELKELLRLLDSQYRDHCERNYGDRDGWTRHVMRQMEEFSDKLDESPYDLIERLYNELRKKETGNVTEG